VTRLPLRTSTAVLAVGLAIVIAIGAGAAGGIVARPAPTPPPTRPPTLAPAPTPEPDTGPLVFEQPLAAGCASDEAVWVVSNGGGIGRFDGQKQKWSLIDSTLRSLVSAACGTNVVIAVGPAGRVVVIDDRARTVRVDDVGFLDLFGVSLSSDGALAVGSSGNVQRQTSAGWQPYARGIEEDLFGIVGFSGISAWAVGSAGIAYRLEEAGWRPFPTGATGVLRTVAGTSSTDAIAAGDGGVLLRFDGRWRPLDSGVQSALRASVRAGPLTYVVGDRGVALVIEDATVSRIDLSTTCALRSVFAHGNEVWFVASDGTHAGVLRRIGDKLDRWGTC